MSSEDKNARSDVASVPERLYLDFDSFFASAEQHFNPSLRGKPVGVVALDSASTGCIAISREAKARGLKTNIPAREARKVIPDMTFVVARPDVYVRLHNRILAVIDTVVPIQHVRSIDEVVCALLPSEGRQAELLAQRIKAALADALPPFLPKVAHGPNHAYFSCVICLHTLSSVTSYCGITHGYVAVISIFINGLHGR